MGATETAERAPATAVAQPGVAGETAIEARGLVKTYPGEVRALDGVDLSVPAGAVFALLGPNGAGKSTTVKILTTLTRPDSGEALVAGHDVLRKPGKVRREIGVVSQRSGCDKDATGRENVRLQGQVFGMRGKALEARIGELLEACGLADAGDRLVRDYSGGMKRRLDIAMSLVHSPRVLFLDEPTTGLDPEIRAAVWEHIAHLARDEGVTIMLTTHYLEEADRLAAQVAIIDRGRLVAQGTPDELKAGLRGDAIQVELAAASDGVATRALEPLENVRDVMVDGRLLHARADDGGRAVPAVLQALESQGVGVASVTVSRPSLDDVYLRHTGRTFSEAERAREQEEIEQGRTGR